MFNFLTQNKNGEMQNYLDLISVDMSKLQLHELATEKAVGMIAKAIAKSEIVIQSKEGRRYDKYYYRLNVRPNDNQTGTDFWMMAVRKLLKESECLICRIGDKYYIAESYQCSDDIMKPKNYTNIMITNGKDQMSINKKMTADDVMHLKYPNEQIREYLKNVLDIYCETLNAVNGMERVANTPFFKLKTEANTSFRKRNDDGTESIKTVDEYMAEIKKQLEGKGITIVRESKGVELEYLKLESRVTADEITKMAKEINAQTAMAFDIPESVFFGNITEKSDATNEFITYAVAPIAEVINDSANAKLVGMEDYVGKHERINVWLARYKHVDVVDSAAALDKLRGIGFNLDEIRELVGYEALNTEFSQERALTKNYSSDIEKEEGNS